MEEEELSQQRRFPKRSTQSDHHPNLSQIWQLARAKLERFILTFPKSIPPTGKRAFAYGGRWPGVFAVPTALGQSCCPRHTAFLRSQQPTQREVGMHHGCPGAGKLQRNLLPDPQGWSEGEARLPTRYLQTWSMQDPAWPLITHLRGAMCILKESLQRDWWGEGTEVLMSQAGTGIDLDAFVNFVNNFREGTQHPSSSTHRHVPPPPSAPRRAARAPWPRASRGSPHLTQGQHISCTTSVGLPGDLSYTLRALQTEAQTRNKSRIWCCR